MDWVAPSFLGTKNFFKLMADLLDARSTYTTIALLAFRKPNILPATHEEDEKHLTPSKKPELATTITSHEGECRPVVTIDQPSVRTCEPILLKSKFTYGAREWASGMVIRHKTGTVP